MEFGKRRDTTDTTRILQTCCGLVVADLLRGSYDLTALYKSIIIIIIIIIIIKSPTCYGLAMGKLV